MTIKLMKTPQALDLDVTNGCNLRCKYCYHFTSAGDVGSDLPLEEWIKFADELGRCSVLRVAFGGGEPFYRRDFLEIIKAFIHNRMRFIVLSNGTLITEEIAAFLEETKRCDRVQVSIDGSNPVTHDSFRGEGTFCRALNGVKNLKKHKITVAVRVTIHKKNVGNLEDIAEFLLEEVGLPAFSTNCAHSLGLCARNAEMVQLTIEEQFLAMQKLLELDKKYNGRIMASAGPLANAQAWLQMEKARQERKEALPGCGYLVSCGGVFTTLAVRADGVIVPCNQMSHIELGRINRDDLKAIWQKHPELKRLRRRGATSLRNFDFCRSCDYVDYCRGGCPALAYTATGSDFHPSADSCLKRYLEKGGKIPREVAICNV